MRSKVAILCGLSLAGFGFRTIKCHLKGDFKCNLNISAFLIHEFAKV